MKRYVGFDARDEGLLRGLSARIEPHAPRIIDEFYDHILRHDDAKIVITGGAEQVDRLKGTLRLWLRGLFEGPWDREYYERRARIGRRHVEINLPQQYMFTATNVIRCHLQRVVFETAGGTPEALDEMEAVHRLLDMELAVMLHTYREDHLARIQRTERLATFGQFVAGIAHEMRNPLGVIESSLFLIRKRLGEVPEQVTKHLDRIQTQIERSNRIIGAMLELVREGTHDPRGCSARELIEYARDARSQRVAASVELEIGPGADEAMIFADPDHVRQILVNLLENASDAAGASGRVRVTVTVGAERVTLAVSDDGPGVDPTVRARLFEPLVTGKPHGIGLGLALCKRLAERNGGTLTLREGPLSGACFVLELSTRPGDSA